MSAAKIHDKCTIMNFWEQKIDNHDQMTQHEELRNKKSALSKLRDEWVKRLERRTTHLKSVNEERIKRAKLAQMTAHN